MLIEVHEEKKVQSTNRKGLYNHMKDAQLLIIIEMYITTTFRYRFPSICLVDSKNVVTWSIVKNVAKQAPLPTADGVNNVNQNYKWIYS